MGTISWTHEFTDGKLLSIQIEYVDYPLETMPSPIHNNTYISSNYISLNSISNHIPLDHISLYTCNSLLWSGIFEIGQEIIEILDEV
jgi:hypothetical protein